MKERGGFCFSPAQMVVDAETLAAHNRQEVRRATTKKQCF